MNRMLRHWLYTLTVVLSGLTVSLSVSAQEQHGADAGSMSGCIAALDHSMRRLHSEEMVDLCELTRTKPLLIINTASHCGFTPQFKALEAVHQEFVDQGLVVIGFASNDFKQEARSEKEAADICYRNYGVSFTMLAQSPVRGDKANPVFNWLAENSTEPGWNFNKYLVSDDRSTVQHFGSRDRPDSQRFNQAVEQLLR